MFDLTSFEPLIKSKIDGGHRANSISTDKANEVIFDTQVPHNTTFSDVELCFYFSDWNNVHDQSGDSEQCKFSQIYTALSIDISTDVKSYQLMIGLKNLKYHL